MLENKQIIGLGDKGEEGGCKQRHACYKLICGLWHLSLIKSYSVLELVFITGACRHSFNQKVVFHQTPLLY